MSISHGFTFSGPRFVVTYRLEGDEASALEKAEIICLEQTVETPIELVPEGEIGQHIVGRIEDFHRLDSDHYSASISFAHETFGSEITQFLNVLFGNSSLKPGIQVEALDLPESILAVFSGPRFGRAGLRDHLEVPERPLLCTALKPMGLSSQELGELCYQFALGGIDLIKDDHGLTDQPFAPFEQRVETCVAAIQRANRRTGRRCVYVPNLTAPAHLIMERARWARQIGAGGVLVAPGLVGFDTMRQLADDDAVGLPILCHPAFLGSFVTRPGEGIGHSVLFGTITRLAGADASIFPNYGGRFSFSRDECQGIADATKAPLGSVKASFPVPGGGMSLARVSDMKEVYGKDVIYLIGGALQLQSSNIVENCRAFHKLVESVPLSTPSVD